MLVSNVAAKMSLNLPLKCTVFEIFAFEKYHDLETRVSGRSRSLERTPFDMLGITAPLGGKCMIVGLVLFWLADRTNGCA